LGVELPEPTVLIVEDEENLLEAVKYNLEKEGYRVFTAGDGERGLEIARKSSPALVILDVMLPKLDGLQVCQLLRRETDVPILMLTAKAEEVDRVVGLELGADDYVTKPFGMRELLARVKALLRRSSLSTEKSPDTAFQFLTSGNLEIDVTGYQVRMNGDRLDLKPREFELLRLLVVDKGRALTRDHILDRLWGHDYIGDTRTVDVHIRWLREKIEADPSSPERIITVRGIGYRFQQ
jgi:two-component system alkaline phosphatase synthesis response regulator PhoP